jgi:outer membrane protein OmpU
MKKVLLTTTALVMTAGVASAEITFSGKGEAGFYRTAPTAAVAAVAGISADNAAETATVSGVEYNADGVLTVTDQTGDNAGAPDADALAVQAGVVGAARAAVTLAQNNFDAAIANDAALDVLIDALAAAQATLAAEERVLALMTGSAAVGKGATPKILSYSGYDMDVAVSGAADNGMTFAMGFDMGAGMIADQDDDRAMDAQAGAIATSAMTIGYAGYTVEIGDDKIDDLYSDDQNGDVSIAGAFGDLSFKIVTDMDADVEAVSAATIYTNSADAGEDTFVERAAVAAVYNPTSYSLGYTMGNVAFAMAGTEHNSAGAAAAKMSLTYTMSDALSMTYGIDNAGSLKDVSELSATAKISDMLSITASIKDDKDHAGNTNEGGKQSQNASIAYAAGSLKATVATDESSAWWVNAQYDLGGGAQAFTTFDHSEFFVAGVNFKF